MALVLVTPTAAPVSMDPADWGLSLGAAAARSCLCPLPLVCLECLARATPHHTALAGLGWPHSVVVVVVSPLIERL